MSRHCEYALCQGMELICDYCVRAKVSLWRGNMQAAEECFRKSDAYTDHLTEPKLGLALCRLHQGDARSRSQWTPGARAEQSGWLQGG